MIQLFLITFTIENNNEPHNTIKCIQNHIKQMTVDECILCLTTERYDKRRR